MAKSPLKQLQQQLTRDQQIVVCYRAGKTVSEISEAFQLTKQRVCQILKKEGCTQADNPKTRNRQLYAFIGANVTTEVKKLVAAKAEAKNLSISAYVSRILESHLKERKL